MKFSQPYFRLTAFLEFSSLSTMRLCELLFGLVVCCLAVQDVLCQTSTVGSATVYAGLQQPYGVVTDTSGALYIADYAARQVFKAAPNSSTPLVYYNATSPATPAISHPTGVCLDSNSSVYVVSTQAQLQLQAHLRLKA